MADFRRFSNERAFGGQRRKAGQKLRMLARANGCMDCMVKQQLSMHCRSIGHLHALSVGQNWSSLLL